MELTTSSLVLGVGYDGRIDSGDGRAGCVMIAIRIVAASVFSHS